MTVVLLAGAVAGLGVLLLALAVVPPRQDPGAALARLDSARELQRARGALGARVHEDRWRTDLGRRVSVLLDSAGIGLGSLRADLSLLGRTLEGFLATSVLAAVGGFVAVVVAGLALLALGWGPGAGTPFVAALLAGVLAGLLPLLRVRSAARARRRDFRHVVGSFLDLVAMSLAGGRGVPEALQQAAELSDDWAMVRIRDALLAARLRGQTPWSALGQLGEEVRVDELRDLAAALALVAEDGAKVRDSLAARANSLRRRELAESEGNAGQDSQSMLVAQLLLAVGFLVFLVYPAMVTVLGGV